MITVISVWRDEEFLAPFFLNHYSFADKIIVFVDTNTVDGTVDFLRQHSLVEVRSISMPDGLSDRIKMDTLSNCYKEIKEGWVIIVDSDEFVLLPEPLSDDFDVYFSETTEVYRHHTDVDLNPSLPTVPQRRFGIRQKDHNPPGCITGKPNLVKAGLEVGWGLGAHTIYGNCNINFGSTEMSHWQMADPEIMKRRHSKRYSQLSAENRANGWGISTSRFEQSGYIEKIAQLHKNDPQVF